MSLKVVGAGLGRTGTASLKVALERLGIGRCYHMGEVMTRPEDTVLWMQAADGNPDWDRLLGDYGATVDYPACTFWRELADYYPEAKVLLSVRDADSWFESTQATIFSKALRDWASASPLEEFMRKTVHGTLGDKIDDRDYMVNYFEERIEQIKSELPADRLLVYQVKEGWGPLCEFLELPVPDEPFPRVNSRDDTMRMIEAIVQAGDDRAIDEVLSERARDLFDR